jgi:hypothetical protein
LKQLHSPDEVKFCPDRHRLADTFSPGFTGLSFNGDIALRCPRPEGGTNVEKTRSIYSIPSPDVALGDGDRRSASSLP